MGTVLTGLESVNCHNRHKINNPCIVFLQLVSIEYSACTSSAYFFRMKYTAMKILIALLCLVFSACSIVQPFPENKEVGLIFHNEVNADLTYGAINDMYNKANEIGANVVYIDSNIDFGSSVTLLGQAYVCT